LWRSKVDGGLDSSISAAPAETIFSGEAKFSMASIMQSASFLGQRPSMPAFLASMASCGDAKTLTMGIGASVFCEEEKAFNPIEAGHVEIHDGEVGIDRVMRLDGFLAIGGFTANLPVGLCFD
jgi:hypothetical protein